MGKMSGRRFSPKIAYRIDPNSQLERIKMGLDFWVLRHFAAIHSGFCFYGPLRNSRNGA